MQKQTLKLFQIFRFCSAASTIISFILILNSQDEITQWADANPGLNSYYQLIRLLFGISLIFWLICVFILGIEKFKEGYRKDTDKPTYQDDILDN